MGGNPHMSWAYWSLQAQMFGSHGNVHQPTIWAARGRLGGGKNLPKLERGQLFCQLKGENWITAGDCGAIVGMPRYRSGSATDTANHFAWLAPLGSASKKQLKTRILDDFSTDGAREACLGKNPHPAEAWPPNGFPRRGEGGEGEIVQNSNSGAFLAEGIYLNRRGSKMAMPLGSIFIPPLLAPTLPRQPSTTPLAGRPWPLARQKHAPRSNSGAFSGREGSAGFQPGYTFAGFILAGNVFFRRDGHH